MPAVPRPWVECASAPAGGFLALFLLLRTATPFSRPPRRDPSSTPAMRCGRRASHFLPEAEFRPPRARRLIRTRLSRKTTRANRPRVLRSPSRTRSPLEELALLTAIQDANITSRRLNVSHRFSALGARSRHGGARIHRTEWRPVRRGLADFFAIGPGWAATVSLRRRFFFRFVGCVYGCSPLLLANPACGLFGILRNLH